MRIAFCLYGQPRCYQEGFNNINEFVLVNKDYQFDFFFHAWTLNENQTYSVSPWRNVTEDEITYNHNCCKELLSLYHPCAYEFENSINNFDENIYIHSLAWRNSSNDRKKNINNTLSQLYSKNKVRNILYNYINNNNVKYDAVIACRFDFKNKIPLILNNINLQCVNLSDYLKKSKTLSIQFHNLLPTNIIVSPVEIFLQWFTTFENLDKLIDNQELSVKFYEYMAIYDMNLEELELASFLYFNHNMDKVCFLDTITNFHRGL